MECKVKDITGKRFGRLVALYATDKRVARNAVWVVQCDCGTIKELPAKNLHGARSCGCSRFTNKFRSHALYSVWRNMMRRCYNVKDEAYKRYGGRGIDVCGRWHDMGNFVADMQPTHTKGLQLERKDNNKGYSPDNCVWATPKEQSNNRRSNLLLTYQGQTKTAAQWAGCLGLSSNIIYNRINRNGWSVERALSTPNVGKKYPRQKKATAAHMLDRCPISTP